MHHTGANHPAQLRRRNRIAQIGIPRMPVPRHRPVRRMEHHRNMLSLNIAAKPPAHLKSIDVRQIHVQQHNIHVLFPGCRYSSFPSQSVRRLKTRQGKQLRQSLSMCLVIVNHQHLQRRRRQNFLFIFHSCTQLNRKSLPAIGVDRKFLVTRRTLTSHKLR